MAEMQLTTDERLKLTYEMRVPQIIELLDMSEQTLQKVRAYKYTLLAMVEFHDMHVIAPFADNFSNLICLIK